MLLLRDQDQGKASKAPGPRRLGREIQLWKRAGRPSPARKFRRTRGRSLSSTTTSTTTARVYLAEPIAYDVTSGALTEAEAKEKVGQTCSEVVESEENDAGKDRRGIRGDRVAIRTSRIQAVYYLFVLIS